MMLADNHRCRSQLIAVAAETYALGLQSQRSGNLSVKIEPGKQFIITRTGSKMGHLRIDQDFLLAEIRVTIPPEASSEAAVHQLIYQLTRHEAVLHTHPPFANAVALAFGSIPVVYNEARAALKKETDVVTIDSTALEEGGEDPTAVDKGLVNSEVLMIRGHGLFVASREIDTCLYLSTVVEMNAKIFLVMKAVG
jgi:L-fuculose-phosphate aldolase